MTQAKETINLMELRKNPAALTKDTVQKALEPYKAALEAFKDACAKFEKDARQKATGANGRRKEVSDRLAEIEREVNGLTSKLPEASLVGGEELEALEDQLDDLNAEASKLKRRISQFEKIENPGSEELYQEVLIAYRNLQETESATSITLTEIYQIADEWAKYFKAISGDATKAKEWGPGLHIGSKSYNKTLVKIAEQHNGPIDVKGHTCGSDEVAKVRFLKALETGDFSGLQNTPAYRILKGIDRPAAPSRPLSEGLELTRVASAPKSETSKRDVTVIVPRRYMDERIEPAGAVDAQKSETPKREVTVMVPLELIGGEHND